MSLGMLCARRAAVLAALAGGFVIAVLAAGLFAEGVVWGGAAFLDAIKGLIGDLLS